MNNDTTVPVNMLNAASTTRRRRHRSVLAAVLLASNFAAVAAIEVEELVGYAYDRSDDRLLYTEQHRFEREQGQLVRHQVDYVAADGALLASKTLDYQTNPYAPEFRLEDQRDQYVEGAAYTKKGYRLFRVRDDKSKDKLLKAGEERVADAGFDQFVRDHLEELLSGEQKEFRMAIAGHLTELRFRATLLDREPLFGVPAARFRIEPASLLRWFADAIDITYATDTGRLLRYVGVTNIRNDEGTSYDARIEFPTNGSPTEAATGAP